MADQVFFRRKITIARPFEWIREGQAVLRRKNTHGKTLQNLGFGGDVRKGVLGEAIDLLAG